MGDETPHPITTPKGSSALALLLAMISVFAPFMVNLTGALAIGTVAMFVIVWIYWSDVLVVFSDHHWNPNLNVPLGSIAIIIAMSMAAVHAANQQPKTIPAPSTDDIIGKVDVILRRDLAEALAHPATAQGPNGQSAPAADRPLRPLVITVSPPALRPASPPVSTAPPAPVSTSVAPTAAIVKRDVTEEADYAACFAKEVSVHWIVRPNYGSDKLRKRLRRLGK